MNANVVKALYFVCGATAGATGMYFGLKKYFELKADIEIEACREAYNRRMAEIDKVKSSMDGEIKGPENIDIGKEPRRSSIAKEFNNKPPMTNYGKYFKDATPEDEKLNLRETIRDPKEALIEQDLAESESPEDDEEMDEEEDDEETNEFEMYQINKDHQDALREGRAPYLIDPGRFEMECAHYSKITLHYYISDGIITTDEDEVIDENELLGNCIETSGFADDDEDLLFVRNDITMADYEIEKMYTQFTG